MSAVGVREGRRESFTNQRCRGASPRQTGTNPRALATNPNPRKAESAPARAERIGWHDPGDAYTGRPGVPAVEAEPCGDCDGTGWRFTGKAVVRCRH